MGILPETYGGLPWSLQGQAQQCQPPPGSQEEAYMEQMRKDQSQNVAPIGFPDTRLLSERLWVSSALSVLRAFQAAHAAAGEHILALGVSHGIAELALLSDALAEEAEPRYA